MGYKTGCVCLNGHHISGSADSEFATPFCGKCGAKSVTECAACAAPIRGSYEGSWGGVDTPVQPHCYACGAAYPWTQKKLDGVAELAEAIEELTSYERDLLAELMPHLIEETPRTSAAAFKIGVVVAKLRPQAKAVLREAIVSVAVDAGKKALGLA